MVFPFGVGDPRDDIDRVARELTGNQFRLKRDDPDAGQKFLDFVAQSEQDFAQIQQSPVPTGVQATPAAAQPTASPVDLQPPRDRGAMQRAETFFNETPLGQGLLGAGRFGQEFTESGMFGAGGIARQTGRLLPEEFLGREPILLTQRETEFDRIFQEARNSGMALDEAFRTAHEALPQRQIPIGQEETGREGFAGFIQALGNQLAGFRGATTGEQRPLFEVGERDLALAAIDPLNVAPVVGDVGLITRPLSAARRGAAEVVEGTLRRGEQAAEAIGRTGVGNVLDPVPARQVVARAARAADDVPPSINRRVNPATIDPRDATFDEITEAIEIASGDERRRLVSILGSDEEAARFERLDRMQDSVDEARAARASAELDEMLTEEQERLIGGHVSQPEVTEEALKDLQSSASFAFEEDAGLLITVLANRMGKLSPEKIQRLLSQTRQEAIRNPDVTHFVAAREATTGLRNLGLSNDQIFEGVVSKLRADGIDDADIDVLIGEFIGGRTAQTPPTTAIQPPVSVARAAADAPPPRVPDEVTRIADEPIEAVPREPVDLPSDAAGRIPPRVPSPADDFVRPSGGDFPPLQDLETQLQVAFNPNVARRVGEVASSLIVPKPLTGFDPSLTATTPGQRAAIGYANLLEEGNLKSDRIFSYANEIGDRQSLFGSDLDLQTGLFRQGDFAGLSLNEIREQMANPAFARKLNPEQTEYLNRLGELDEKATELYERSGKVIGRTEDDDILFGSRRVFAKIDPETGEIIRAEPVPTDRPVAGKVSSEQARRVRTAEQLREQGFVLLPYDETVRLKIRQAYRVAAEAELDKWVRANYEFKEVVDARTFKEAQTRLYKGQLPTTTEGERFVNDLSKALDNLQASAPQGKTRLAIDTVNQVGRTAALSGDASIFLIQFLLAMGKDFLPVTAQAGLRNIRPKVPGALFGTTAKNFGTQLVRGFVSPARARRFNAELLQNNRQLLGDTRSLIMFGTEAAPEITEGVSKVRNIADYLEAKGGIRAAAGRTVRTLARPLDSFQQATATAMNAAGIHMLKSLKPLTRNADGSIDPQRLQDVEDFINNFRGITSSARLGVSPKRRWQEGLVALAARYRRATAALYTSAAQGGLRGQLARDAIASGVLGLSSAWIGYMLMKGQSEGWSLERTQREIADTFNPNSGKFMVTEIEGQMVGPGSKLISDLKFIARIMGNPAALLDAHPERNPFIRWARSQSSFALGTATDILSGRDVVGNVTRPGAPAFGGDDPDVSDGLMGLVREISGLGIMLWFQSALFEGGSAKQRTIRAGADFLGARAYEQGRSQILDDASWQALNKPWDDLNQLEKFNLQENPELKQTLHDLDEARADSGDKFADYRIRRSGSEEAQRQFQQDDLDAFIVDLYSMKSANDTWRVVSKLSDRISDTKGNLYANLAGFREGSGISNYVGEEPKNDFDRMLNEWYDLIDEHTQKTKIGENEFKGRLIFDTWVPAADKFIEGLSPELQQQLEEWRARKEDIEGVKELLELRSPIGVKPDGSPRHRTSKEMLPEVTRILDKIGITNEYVQGLRASQ